jgi:hypothetical protein
MDFLVRCFIIGLFACVFVGFFIRANEGSSFWEGLGCLVLIIIAIIVVTALGFGIVKLVSWISN